MLVGSLKTEDTDALEPSRSIHNVCTSSGSGANFRLPDAKVHSGEMMSKFAGLVMSVSAFVIALVLSCGSMALSPLPAAMAQEQTSTPGGPTPEPWEGPKWDPEIDWVVIPSTLFDIVAIIPLGTNYGATEDPAVVDKAGGLFRRLEVIVEDNGNILITGFTGDQKWTYSCSVPDVPLNISEVGRPWQQWPDWHSAECSGPYKESTLLVVTPTVAPTPAN